MNITIRHLVGGFIGGCTGIVLLHFAGFWSMCGGCVFGFIGGFWAPEIYADMRRPWHVSAHVQSLISGVLNPISSEWCKLMELLQALRGPGMLLWQKTAGILGIFFLKMLPKAIAMSFVWCVRAPAAFVRWTRAHTMNRSWVATMAASILWIGAMWYVAHWMYANYSWYEMNGISKQMENQGGMYYCAAFIAALFGVCGVIMTGDDRDLPSYYRRYERWSRGSARFAIVEFLKMAYVGVGTLILICVGLPTLLVGTVIVYLAVFAAVVLGSLVKCAFILTTMSTRKAHWTGVGVTLATTVATALLTRHMLNDITVWLVALGNGVCCGLLSAGAYNLMKMLFRNTNIIERAYGDPFQLIETIPKTAWLYLFKPVLVVSVRPLN